MKAEATTEDILAVYNVISNRVFYHPKEYWLCIISKSQIMHLMSQKKIMSSYAVSTALNGLGSENGSFKTPKGLHFIIDKIGQGANKNIIFKARQETANYAQIIQDATVSEDDLITSRILRLSGLDVGKNYGDNVDTYKRYIYIHGTNEEGLIGKAVSHGCIRMKNDDVIQLFEKIPNQTLVYIK